MYHSTAAKVAFFFFFCLFFCSLQLPLWKLIFWIINLGESGNVRLTHWKLSLADARFRRANFRYNIKIRRSKLEKRFFTSLLRQYTTFVAFIIPICIHVHFTQWSEECVRIRMHIHVPAISYYMYTHIFYIISFIQQYCSNNIAIALSYFFPYSCSNRDLGLCKLYIISHPLELLSRACIFNLLLQFALFTILPFMHSFQHGGKKFKSRKKLQVEFFQPKLSFFGILCV